MTIAYRTGSKPAGVRADYSEQAIWRNALGGKAPLLVFSVWGDALDAPEHIPAGSLSASRFGPFQNATQRSN